MSLKKKTVLFVDDDPVAMKLLIESFKKVFGLALHYEKAANAQEAEEAIIELLSIRGSLPSMIVSDWMMPGKRGDEFLTEVNQNYPEIPLVLHSGLARQDTVDTIRKACDLLCALPKPWDGRTEIDKLFGVLSS
jgi:CheY-like chemotaxis protein